MSTELCALEVGQYIENIADIGVGIISALYIGFSIYIDIVSITSEILVIFQYFTILFLTF